MATHITIPTARLIELETAEHERDILRTESAALKREAHTWSKAAETYATSEARMVDALHAVLSSNVGRQTLAQLGDGQGTATADGQAWLAAAALVLGPNVGAKPKTTAQET